MLLSLPFAKPIRPLDHVYHQLTCMGVSRAVCCKVVQQLWYFYNEDAGIDVTRQLEGSFHGSHHDERDNSGDQLPFTGGTIPLLGHGELKSRRQYWNYTGCDR